MFNKIENLQFGNAVPSHIFTASYTYSKKTVCMLYLCRNILIANFVSGFHYFVL